MFFKKYRRKIALILFILSLFMIGVTIEPLLDKGFESGKDIYLQLTAPISMFLLSLFLYYELFITKKLK